MIQITTGKIFMLMSILILTHKRPELFHRCLLSALKDIPANIEILVNNDSRDIIEIPHSQVKYFYENPEHLSDKYKLLLDKSTGEYIYYLEDDDYLVQNFYKIVLPYLKDYDIIGGNYYPTWNDEWVMRCTSSMSNSFNLDGAELQLGQFIMRRSIARTFQFAKDSHIHNDKRLVQHVYSLSKNPININKVLYFQTTDGGDNISFPESPNYYGF